MPGDFSLPRPQEQLLYLPPTLLRSFTAGTVTGSYASKDGNSFHKYLSSTFYVPCTRHCSRCLGYSRASEGPQAGKFPFTFSRGCERDLRLHFPSLAQLTHPKPVFFFPSPTHWRVDWLSPCFRRLSPPTRNSSLGGLACRPLSSSLLFLSDIFRSTCKIPRINVCASAISLSPPNS